MCEEADGFQNLDFPAETIVENCIKVLALKAHISACLSIWC